MMTNQTNVNSLNNEERGVENCTATQGQDSLLKDVGIPMEKKIDRIVDSFQTAYGCAISPDEIHKLDALLSKGVTEELCLFACKVFSTSKRPFQEVLRALGRPYDAHEQELAEEMQLWYRLRRGYRWFPDEQPSDSIKARVERKLEQSNWQIDAVFSHTCPYRYIPREAFMSSVDQSTVEKRYMKHVSNKKVGC